MLLIPNWWCYTIFFRVVIKDNSSTGRRTNSSQDFCIFISYPWWRPRSNQFSKHFNSLSLSLSLELFYYLNSINIHCFNNNYVKGRLYYADYYSLLVREKITLFSAKNYYNNQKRNKSSLPAMNSTTYVRT